MTVNLDKEFVEKLIDALVRLNRTGDTQVFDMYDAPELIPVLKAALKGAEDELGATGT